VGWTQGWIAFQDADSDQNVDAGETIISTSGAVDRLTFSSGEFGLFMMYRPNGRVMNTTVNGNSGEFTICDQRGAGHAKVMIIELSGRPRISRRMADGSAASCV
jgi:Tfp pilus assembly protein FimT